MGATGQAGQGDTEMDGGVTHGDKQKLPTGEQTSAACETGGTKERTEQQMFNRGLTSQEAGVAHGFWEEWAASGSHLESQVKVKSVPCPPPHTRLSINCSVKTTDRLLCAANEPGGQAEEEKEEEED